MNLNRRLAAVVTLLLVTSGLAVTAAAGSNLAVRATAAATTFSDPAGDANGAPDITAVAIDGDASSGTITFSITAGGFIPASPDGRTRYVEAYLNTDKNAATGSKSGADFALFAKSDQNGSGWGADKWVSGAWQDAVTPAMQGSKNGDTITWTLNKSDLGGTSGFSFYTVASLTDASNNDLAEDWAPDGDAWWTWDMPSPSSTTSTTTTASTTTSSSTTNATTSGETSAPPRTMTHLYKPVIGKPVTVPARAVAGKRLVVSFRVTRSDDGEPLMSGKMICDPSVAGKVVKHAELFKNGVARLSFVVPKSTRGKQLKVKVTIKAPSYKGEDGIYFSVTAGGVGVEHNVYSGGSATKTVSLAVR